MAEGDIKYTDSRMSKIFDTREEAEQMFHGIGPVCECVEREIQPHLSAKDFIEQLDCDAFDQGGEDFSWSEQISKEEIAELQTFLDKWCSNYKATVFELLATEASN